MFRILVVDDNLTNLDVTSRMLQKAGYGVATAARGGEGIRMAGLWRYDLIIMDMAMPDISGGEATSRIRSQEKASGNRRVPVIAFTAHANSDVRQRAMRNSMDDFITKPIEVRQLLAAVERSLDRRDVVLVVDESASDRGRTMGYLRSLERICVIGASSGQDAVATCSRQRVTFALIDQNLPDMSASEAASQIRATGTGREVSIIAVNGKVDPEARKSAVSLGYTGYLEKPFRQTELLRVLQGPAVPARITAVPA